MAMTVEPQRSGAEVYHGREICKKKAMEMLDEISLPRGLLPLDDLEECGYVKETGYVWMKQKKKVEHCFKKIGKLVQFGTEVTAFVEKHKMKNLTGIKSKELFFWVTIVEISRPESSPNSIYFKSSTGIGKSFPASAFAIEEEKAADSSSADAPAPAIAP